jgi:flagellar basal-body rod modification protein FlgD
MAAAAGIFNHQEATQTFAGKAAPMTTSSSGTSGTSGSGDSSSDGATISANDFLTLLVTEMQNQDPTADTDPNEYINQLVEVNSLEQLININQTLTTDLPAPTSASSQDASTPAAAATQSKTAAASEAYVPATSRAATNSLTASHAPGNLSVPAANSSAKRVAHALDGRIATHKSPSPLQ